MSLCNLNEAIFIFQSEMAVTWIVCQSGQHSVSFTRIFFPFHTSLYFITKILFSSVRFGHSVVSDSLRPHEPQHARLPCPSLSLRVRSDSCPLSQWCYLTILFFATLFSLSLFFFSLPPSSLFALNLSQHQGLFQWVSSLYQVAKVLELQLQHQSFQWIFRTDLL